MLNYFDVIKAQSGVPVKDIWAQLWGNTMSTEYVITTYEGTLPATLTGTKDGYLHRYKVYGNVGENLLEIEPEMLNEANWTLPSRYFMYYQLGAATTERLKKSGTIAGTVYLVAGGTYYNGEVLAITSEMKAGNVTTSERLLENGGNPLQYSADVSEYNDIYLCIGYASGIGSSNKQTLINALFDNFDIMLVEGSTAPSSFIPYGYKLPLLSGSTPVDVYIGDDTLSDSEHVDSGTGKIYRVVGGVLTPVDPPVPFPQIPTSSNSTTISWAGQGLAPSEVELEYEKRR